MRHIEREKQRKRQSHRDTEKETTEREREKETDTWLGEPGISDIRQDGLHLIGRTTSYGRGRPRYAWGNARILLREVRFIS